jgi:MinD superfamily P-loop ATPase
LAQDIVVADCDVDAPDLHMLLNPSIKKETPFQATKVAEIDTEKCTECGICEEHCRFDAISPPVVNPIACEGCGVCEYVCPEQAVYLDISMNQTPSLDQWHTQNCSQVKAIQENL